MKKNNNNTVISTSEEMYEFQRERRDWYCFLSILMIVLPFAGHLFYHGLIKPSKDTGGLFALNFGTYGFIGVVLVLLIVFLILGIKMIAQNGLTSGFIKACVVYVLTVGVITGILEVGYTAVDWKALFTSWGIADFFILRSRELVKHLVRR